MDLYQTISQGIAAIKSLTNIQLLWKGIDEEKTGRIPQESCTHQTRFCLYMKSKPLRLARCQLDDNVTLVIQAIKDRQPFIKECHGGVVDYIIPVFDHMRYLGSFFCGPWRMAESVCNYKDSLDAFQQIPLYDEDQCRAVHKLLGPYVEMIIHEKSMPKLSARLTTKTHDRIESALAIIHDRYNQGLTAEAVAHDIHLSTSRFIHLFKEATGVSFSVYLIHLRIEEARKLLRHTRMPIGEIAYEVGYSGQSYFTAIFRKHTGYTPREYRNQ